MNSPIHAIEAIAKSEDRSRAIVFFLFFSRFEYALKRAGYVASSEEARADWQKYARDHSAFLTDFQDDRVYSAAELLKNSPPKKQVVSDGRLCWRRDRFNGEFHASRLLMLVCRIRNNLFHGGKFPGGPEADIERDRELVDAGLAIMQACLDSDHRLRDFFLEDLR